MCVTFLEIQGVSLDTVSTPDRTEATILLENPTFKV